MHLRMHNNYLVLSHLGLAFVIMLRPFFPELVMSTDLLSFEHPSVLLFSFDILLKSVHYSAKLQIAKSIKMPQT